jgi:hypothetical protein
MGDSTLFSRGCCNNSTEKQLKSLREACIFDVVVDSDECKKRLNTCGMSVEELLSMYELYNPQKGLYKKWGDIPFPWETNEFTNNIDWDETDDRWQVSEYKSLITYYPGDRVLVIEQDGYELSLYEATEEILTFPAILDPSKWEKICSVKTTVPVGLPTIDQLYSSFELYDLQLFYTEWGEFDSEWDEELKEQSLQSCLGENPGATLAELEKCIDDGRKSTDQWNKARKRKDFLYRRGDIFLVLGECGDTLCPYVVVEDIPATNEVFDQYKTFKPSQYWEKLYCVSTGENKCLGPQRTKRPEEGYEFVEIGSKGHFVEKPIPYKLSPPIDTLDELTQKFSPRVLTPKEIDVLDGTLSPECLKG